MRAIPRFWCFGALALACLTWCGLGLDAAEPDAAMRPTVGSIERLDPRLDALVPPDARIEVLAMGFAWSEGPVWVAEDRGGVLLFSDIPHNRIHRWKEGEEVRIFVEPAGFTGPHAYVKEPGSNGLALDREGRLVACEHGDRRVSVLEMDGGKRTIADAWAGKRFNSPNDLAVHSSGAVRPPLTVSPGSTADSQSMPAFGSRLLTGRCRGNSRAWSICCVPAPGRRLQFSGFRLCRARATDLSGFATPCLGTSAGTGSARDVRESQRGPGPAVSSS